MTERIRQSKPQETGTPVAKDRTSRKKTKRSIIGTAAVGTASLLLPIGIGSPSAEAAVSSPAAVATPDNSGDVCSFSVVPVGKYEFGEVKACGNLIFTGQYVKEYVWQVSDVPFKGVPDATWRGELFIINNKLTNQVGNSRVIDITPRNKTENGVIPIFKKEPKRSIDTVFPIGVDGSVNLEDITLAT